MDDHNNPIHLHFGKPPGYWSVCNLELGANLIEAEKGRLVLVNMGA